MTCEKILIAGGAVLALMAGHGAAQAMSRDQVRLRVLDKCVMSQSGKAEDEGAGPKCGCYAPKIVKLMTDEEVAKFRKAVPARLKPESDKLLQKCD
jgi:hypothetical protein